MKKTLTKSKPNVVSRRHGEQSGHANPTTTNASAAYRSVFVSDVHIGTKDCQAKRLNAFLKQHPCDHLYLVGDIFDGWRLQKNFYWDASFNQLIRRILKLSKRGVRVTYITGNHDEFLRKYANHQFDNIILCNRSTHLTADGQRLLVIHGDQFEGVARCGRVLKYIGDYGYAMLMFLNRWFNKWRAKYGFGYWSFSGFLKQRLQRAKTYIEEYEQAVALGAKKQGFDGVVCGHIHQAAHKTLHGVSYFNTGDWVESCTAIVEHACGRMELKHWSDTPAPTTQDSVQIGATPLH